MALKLENKKAIVAEVNAIASTALSAAAASYRGLSVTQLTQLRQSARAANVKVRVVRNTLARRAFVGTEFECLSDTLVGPLVLAFAMTEPGAAARVFRDFKKANDKFDVKALALGGKALAANQLEAVAKLPTRDEALATLLSVMIAPITKFVRTVAEPTAQCVRVIAAVRDQKQS